MSAYITSATTAPTSQISITPLGPHATMGVRDHCESIDNASLYYCHQCETAALADEDHRFGVFAFENVTPQPVFDTLCASIGRPELVRQSRMFPTLAPPGAGGAALLKVQQDNFNLGQARANQIWDAVKATWSPAQKVTFDRLRFPHMAAYRVHIEATYGMLDDKAVDSLKAAIAIPFDPQGDIDADLANIQLNINRLPVDERVVYNAAAKIAIALRAMRPEEATKVTTQLDGLFPIVHSRTWAQFEPIASAQVKNYRFQNPYTATAAAGGGKKGGHVADEKQYCFGHNTNKHSGDACTGLIAYATEHGKQYAFLSKLKTNRDIKIKGKDVTLKAGFLYADKKKGHEAAPKQDAPPRRRPPAAAASVDGSAADQDDLSAMSGWETADGSDV
jgi:hypothetical protein